MRIFALALLLLFVAAGHASAQVCAFVPNYSTGPGSGDGIVSIIPTDINKVVRNIPVGLIPGGTAFTPDGSTLYVANSSGNTVSVLRTSDGLVTATIPVGDSPDGMVVTPDGQFLYVANFNGGTISVIRTSDNTVTGTIDLIPEQVRSLSVSPDGKRVFVTSPTAGGVYVIRTSDNAVVDFVPLPGRNHVPLEHDPCFPRILDEVKRFLSV
jgi:YVTN family beta-propeller protein